MRIKKVMAISGCLAVLTASVTAVSQSFDVPVFATSIAGDANSDGRIDSKDAVLILKDYAQRLAGGSSAINTAVADINNDGVVDSKDAVVVLKKYAESLAGSSSSGGSDSGSSSSGGGSGTSGGSSSSGGYFARVDYGNATYVVNDDTMKFHVPTCRTIKRSTNPNIYGVTNSRDDIVSKGYSPCGVCDPY